MGFRFEGTSVRPNDFFGLVASRGEINSVSVIKKFGRNDAVGTTFEPIALGGVYQTPTTAVSLEFNSDNNGDALNGAGMHELTVTGLDANWNEQTVVTAAHPTAGTTVVAIEGTWLRIYRMYVSKSGTYGTTSSGSHLGDITLRVVGAGAIYAQITNTNYPRGQTEIAAFTVPKGRSGYISEVAVSVDGNQTGNCMLLQRPIADDVSSSYTGTMRAVVVYDGIQQFTIDENYPLGPFVGPCDLIWMGRVGASTGSFSVNFTITQVQENVPSAGS